MYNIIYEKTSKKINIYFSIKMIQNYLKYNKTDFHLLNLKTK